MKLLIKSTMMICALYFLSGVVSVQAASPDGKALHQKFCVSCHGLDQYGPSKRKINDLGALKRRIKGCSRAAGADWSESEMQAVLDYLNQSFYQLNP